MADLERTPYRFQGFGGSTPGGWWELHSVHLQSNCLQFPSNRREGFLQFEEGMCDLEGGGWGRDGPHWVKVYPLSRVCPWEPLIAWSLLAWAQNHLWGCVKTQLHIGVTWATAGLGSNNSSLFVYRKKKWKDSFMEEEGSREWPLGVSDSIFNLAPSCWLLGYRGVIEAKMVQDKTFGFGPVTLRTQLGSTDNTGAPCSSCHDTSVAFLGNFTVSHWPNIADIAWSVTLLGSPFLRTFEDEAE